MKSFALILWLVLANGREQVLATKHYDSLADCQKAAQMLKEEHASKGRNTRSLCHLVIEEDTNVDEYGNPVKPKP